MIAKDYIFLYGTLRKEFNHHVFKKVEDKLDYVGKGFVKGKIFDIGEYPGLIESTGNQSVVEGDVYSIKNETEKVFKLLDRYEGFIEGNLNKSEYIRKRKDIQLIREDKKIRSWIYIYNRTKHKNFKEIFTGDYLKYYKTKKNA
ncbi:MAG: gamma-glutamylcyclotransferase family protein [Bacteroidia bacterium]